MKLEDNRKYSPEEEKNHVLFDGKGIQSAIIRYVNKDETKYVVGCIAWLSNKAILRAMAKKKRCNHCLYGRTDLPNVLPIKMHIKI